MQNVTVLVCLDLYCIINRNTWDKGDGGKLGARTSGTKDTPHFWQCPLLGHVSNLRSYGYTHLNTPGNISGII